jgi:hypothetical protein
MNGVTNIGAKKLSPPLMILLRSKIQYKNFEPGEFVDIRERNYDDTIALIETFPWTTQREKIAIDLTNPSVTIEGKNKDFLKCSIYYNGKFVLNYLDQQQVLYTKSISQLSDGYEYIRHFFEHSTPDITSFKKQTTWLQHNLKHFLTRDFHYFLTAKSIRRYLVSTSGLNLMTSIILLVLSFSLDNLGPIVLFIILMVIIIFGGGLHLFLFFTYYHYLKGKVLIMSRGNDQFYFGTAGSPIKYDKKDILQYKIIKTSGSRNLFSEFAIVEIDLKDGTVLKIPNLLIRHEELEYKLFEYPKIEVSAFPYLERQTFL